MIEKINTIRAKKIRVDFLCCVLTLILVVVYLNSTTFQTKLTEQAVEISELEIKLLQQKITTSESDMRAHVRHIQPKLDPAIVDSICSAVELYCGQYGLNTNLVISLIFRESSFNLFSASNKECYGLMQIRYKVHKKLLKEFGINSINELYYVNNNIHAGCAILSSMLAKEKTVSGALKRYVGGKHETYIPDIFRLMAEFSNPAGTQKKKLAKIPKEE